MKPQKADYPFKTVFSILPLIDYWKKIEKGNDEIEADYARRINEELAKAPELFKPIEDFSILKKHKKLIDSLMGAILSPASKEFDLYAAIAIPDLQCFYQTERFKSLNLFENTRLLQSLLIDTSTMHACTVIGTYAKILGEYYNINVSYEYPLIYRYPDPATGLDRWVRIRMLPWFVQLTVLGKTVPFSEENKKLLFENLTNPDVLKELIPSENFELSGFMIFNAIDITDQQIISLMKYDLIDKDILMKSNKIQVVQDKFKALLRKPNISLGLVSLPAVADATLCDGQVMGNSFVMNRPASGGPELKNYDGSVYEQVLKKKEIVIIHDLRVLKNKTAVEQNIIDQGINNLYIAPLTHKEEIVGIMELGSPEPGDLNKVNTLKLNEVHTLFAACLKTGMEDFNKSIQSVIKEKCTAIHPSVEWRFRRAALDYIRSDKGDTYDDMEEIVFDNVYPLYGLSDIRDSSRFRNATIQADLIDNLSLAKEIISVAANYEKLPILDELGTRISLQIREAERGLSSSDETNILSFLHSEVESLFEHLKKYGSDVSGLIRNYCNAVDSKLGLLYKKRKEFDDCVTLINETISAELDNYEDVAQRMFPHYFEKYKTDGVEHTMYIGASLVESRNFNIMYLKNLRLWQLMMMCGIVRKTKSLKETLKIPLETTHLVLVQNSPLAIRFQYDEKKFDVDGTYNIRYEILKKRIDKAELKGSEERLTQPGKIAIVYSQDSEAAEYKLYIEYLRSKGYLLSQFEFLELQDMQGVQGLKAIRVAVNTNPPQADEQRIDEKEFTAAIKELSTNN